MKENGLHVGTDGFAKVGEGNLARGGHPCINLGYGHGAFVCFDEKAGHGRRPDGFFLEFRAEGEE